MDTMLARLISDATPNINETLAHGLAIRHMQDAEAYIDSVFRAVAKGFPPGLTYVRGERCSPAEEFAEITRRKANKRTYDVARSDIYLMKYFFKFKNEEIHRYLFLPFVSDGGVIYISGSRFVISPVLADRVISIGTSSIFVRLVRAKLTFERMGQHYMANDRRETVQVAWSLVYNKDPKTRDLRPEVKCHTTLVHYLLCKYGFTEMFNRFGNASPITGYADTINEANYPTSEWVICSSTGVKQKSYGRRPYTPSKFRLAIRRSEYNHMTKSLICGLFYVIDHFPQRVTTGLDFLDSTMMWKILMGHILFGEQIVHGKLADDVDEHIRSLDEYVDEVMKIKFREVGLPIDDIYQLFGEIIGRINEMLLGAGDKINSMYDKELNILYFVLSDITTAINKFYFALKAAMKKEQQGKEITAKDINNLLQQSLKTGLIYSLNKKHGEVSAISVPGDNKAFKLTSLLIPQASSTKSIGKKDNAVLNDPSKHLHVSVAEVGGYSNMPKSDPSGHSRLNLHVKTDSRGTVLRNPALAELLDNVQQQIKR